MRIFFVTNYYPPHYIGGYELHCARVAEWACRAGHRVRVLTGDFRREGDLPESAAPELEFTDPVGVFRELELRYWRDVADLGYWRREWRDLARFRRHLAEFKPDVVVLWNMRKLASGIVLEAQRQAERPAGPPLIYHLMDEWAAEFRTANGLPQFWSRPAHSWWGRLVKPPLRALCRALFTPDVSAWRPENAVLVSKALGELLGTHNVHFARTHVSYITYDPELFNFTEPLRLDCRREEDPNGPTRFLWAGRLCEAKGALTTLDALDDLFRRRPVGWTVDFCGPIDPELEQGGFHERLRSAPWNDRVRYLGSLPHEAMPQQYRNRDVFLFTSEVHEGLPGAVVEAFAAGMAVIGTLTGGTRDVLRPDENCLVYPMGDAGALADAMEKLIVDGALRRRLSSRVAAFAREECSNDAVFPRLLAFYEALLREKHKSPERPST